MIAIKVEYEGESVNVALYEGIEMVEFNDVILSSLHVKGTIIGLKDINGVILLPKYICQNVSNIQQSTYELVIKTKDGRPISPPHSHKAEAQKPGTQSMLSYIERSSSNATPSDTTTALGPQKKTGEVALEQEISQLIKFLRLDGFLSEPEEHSLSELLRSNNPDLLSINNMYHQ